MVKHETEYLVEVLFSVLPSGIIDKNKYDCKLHSMFGINFECKFSNCCENKCWNVHLKDHHIVAKKK